MKKKKQSYIRAGILSLEEVIPVINSSPGKHKHSFKIDDDIYIVNVYSGRLNLFTKSVTCVRCGIVGTHFALEKSHERDKSYHLNLYSRNGKGDILMTKDHIVPRSKGGKDHIDNYQTMCCNCNNKKKDKIMGV